MDVTRYGLGLAPERQITYNNFQGKTVRLPDKSPIGLTVDLQQPNYMKGESAGDYWQHLYMILGRARKLSWMLLRNLPRKADGEVDWSFFESGPPPYVEEAMERLEAMHAATNDVRRMFCV